MRCVAHTVFVLSMVYFTQARLGLVGRTGPIGPPGPPGNTLFWRLKYCPVSSTITAFLKKVGSLKTSGRRARRGALRRNHFGRGGFDGMIDVMINWPYNCLHAGLNYNEGVFEMDTYQCCKSCEYPSYSHCTGRYRSSAGQDRCNSEAMRCIAKCINTKGDKGRPGPTGRPAPVIERPYPPGRPGPPGPKGSCTTKTKKVGGSWCKERSCIRI